MRLSETLVSIGLPVRNGGQELVEVIYSILAQDHSNIQLVISDNASTDDTEEICRELARSDSRIAYHRQPRNIGLLNNFMATIQLADGSFFRWIGDDDWLAPDYVSRCLDAYAADDRLLLVTTRIAYTDADGVSETSSYLGTALSSDDPVERFTELLRLLNESSLVIDPLYSLVRRTAVVAIPRRNMLQEDQVFAAKLALAGPWGHVPEVLAHRNRRPGRLTSVARLLDVPRWHAHAANTLQCMEVLRWLGQTTLDGRQRRAARAALARMYLRRERRTIAHHGGKLARLAGRGRRRPRQPAEQERTWITSS